MANGAQNRGALPLVFGLVVVVAALGFFLTDESEAPPEAREPAAPENTSTQGDKGGKGGLQSPETERVPAYEGPGYVLRFADDFPLGMNRVDDLGISVVIAVDSSGSMEDAPAQGDQSPKYLQAQAALRDIIDFLQDLRDEPYMEGMVLKLGILGFYSELDVILDLERMDNAAFARLREELDRTEVLLPGGRTAIGKALERGAEMLAQSGTVLKSMVVISDGENTEAPEPQEVLWAINENRNDKSFVDYPIMTRGILTSFIGFDIDPDLFSPLAREGARVIPAADGKELVQVLRQVLVADITMLEAGAP